MPELPDITVYLDALAARVLNQPLEQVDILNPFLLRTAAPAPTAAVGQTVAALSRMGKRIVIATDNDLYFVVHLMIAGRLAWRDGPAAAKSGKASRNTLARWHFPTGTLTLTEAGSKRRAALHMVAGRAALAALDPGGLEVLEHDRRAFAARLTQRNHTLKRALTDPRLFSGIGNAYSDEILHAARLSPIQQTQKLTDVEITRLYTATVEVLQHWTERLRADCGAAFPKKVTAFRDGMAVHGRYREPCPVCATAVQRIRYASNEVNYCPRCQTGGKLLADRALSRLLRKDWPRTIEELESGNAATSDLSG